MNRCQVRRDRVRRFFRVHALILGLLIVPGHVAPTPASAQAVDWLPDIIIRESDLYNNDIVTTISAGRRHLRFNNSTANVGLGRLHLIGTLPALPDGSQLVLQRIFRDDGTFWEDTSGAFLYHPTHSHTHFEDWCEYRLREILPGDGVGDIVAQGAKTSFCILDLGVYSSSLPNYNPNPFYPSCGSTIQGLSVGWFDLYSKSLPGQNIDITNVPDGQYWLEAEADPVDNVRESNESNNITRIKVMIGEGSTIALDAFEPNDSIPQVLGHIEGAPNSSNMGPVGPRIVVSDLTLHTEANKDYYRFYCAGPGTSADTVRIDFVHAVGDLDMRLRDSTGASLVLADGSTNREIILLTNRPAGWYYLEVFGYQDAVNSDYTLTINPPANTAPSITVSNPPAGISQRAHGFENYMATWVATDVNSDPTWVTVYLNTDSVLDGNELVLEGSYHTIGADGYHIINSAAVPPGLYWVYCEVTDGGQVSGDWSDGQIEFLTSFDTDADGVYDYADNCIGWANPTQEPGCSFHGDPQGDGQVDILDAIAVVSIAFREGAPVLDADCPHGQVGRSDLNCDGVTDILDVSLVIEAAFRGGSEEFCDPCACASYPSSCP